MLAISNAAIAGIYGIATTAIAAAATVVVAVITKDTRHQSKKVTETVGEFERAWNAMRKERESDRRRIAGLEEREDNCLEALALAHARMAVLEERLGIRPGD